MTEEFVKDTISKLTGSEVLFGSHPDLDRRSWKDFTFELNAGFHKYGVNTCMQKISFLATAYAETDFRLLVEGLSQYNSSKSFYKGRGIIQLTGSAKDKNDILYSAPGAYLSYGKYIKQENKFVNTPNLISDMLHYAIDSAFWEWTIFKRVPSWGVGKDDSKALAEAKQFKREYFKDGLGKDLNALAILMEKEEDKYFWLQQKMINGYIATQKLEKDPHGWDKRKKGLKYFKEVFEYETRCKGIDELLNFGDGTWHDPVDNPRRTKYNSNGNIKPVSGAYGGVRNQYTKYHSGLDLFGLPYIKDEFKGTKIYACLDGVVADIQDSINNEAGRIIRIKIDNVNSLLEQETRTNYTLEFKKGEIRGIDIKETDDVYFIYMHLSEILVKKDQRVKVGEHIGYTGVSGNIATNIPSPHLHLEISTKENPYGSGKTRRTNPARFIKLNSYDTKDQDDAVKYKYKQNGDKIEWNPPLNDQTNL